MRCITFLPVAFYTLLSFAGLVFGNRAEYRAIPGIETASCPQDIVLTPETWKRYGAADYLMRYPNITRLTLSEFAAEVGAPNFVCGLGRDCNAGQICSPVIDMNWIILRAIQRWNEQLNSLHTAVQSAISIVTTQCVSIVSDFLPNTKHDNTLFGWSVATLVFAGLALVSAPLAPMFAPKAIVDITAAYQSERSLAQVAGAYEQARLAAQAGDTIGAALITTKRDHTVFTGLVGQAHNKVPALPPHIDGAPRPPQIHPPHPPATKRSAIPQPPTPARSTSSADLKTPTAQPSRKVRDHLRAELEKRGANPLAFGVFAGMESYLAKIETRLQAMLSELERLATTKPVYGTDGIARSIFRGDILGPQPSVQENQVAFTKFAKLSMLFEYLLSQNHFVTVGCTDCHYKGENGAWFPDKHLSYCDPVTKEMRNIIRAEGIHARNEFRNAEKLTKDYFSVKDLTDMAIKCQKQYGFYKDQKFPQPETWSDPCVFALPVCFCKEPKIAQVIGAKQGTVTACRHAGDLPI